MFQEGEELEVDICDVTQEGAGVARHEGWVLFVDDALPGERWRVLLRKRRRQHWKAQGLQLLQASPDRQEPACAHAQYCGGCKWQHWSYAAQLVFKQKHVSDALERIGGLELPEHQPILAAPQALAYRNKLEYTFTPKAWVPDAVFDKEAPALMGLGYHLPGRFDRIFQVDSCQLMPERFNSLRNWLGQFARSSGREAYNTRSHAGFWRNLVIRQAEGSHQAMALVIVSEDDAVIRQSLSEQLPLHFPWLSSLGWVVNAKKNDQYSDLPVQLLYGPAFLTESLGERSYRVGPTSFFQTNTAQAKNLYDVVRHFVQLGVGPGPVPLLYDLYCGAGSIGIYLADLAQRIVGVEYIAAAVDDARANAALNQLSHLSFEAGDMAKLLNADFVARHGRPDVVVSDPPRAGMDPKVVQALLDLAPARIVYVSCNPATQARDLALMNEAFAITALQAVDMFPQTSHVENVALLIRRY